MCRLSTQSAVSVMSSAKNKSAWSIAATLTATTGAIIAFGTFTAFVTAYYVLAEQMMVNSDRYLKFELREFEEIYRTGGFIALDAEFRRQAEAQGTKRIFMCVVDRNGSRVLSSDLSLWGPAADWNEDWPLPDETRYRTVPAGESARTARRGERAIAPNLVAMLGVLTIKQDLFLSRVRVEYLTLFGIVLSVCVLGAWYAARRATRGIKVLTQAAQEIANGALGHRIADSGFGVEADHMATVFNQMVDRIEMLLFEARTMSDNIAHELRSPLTRLRFVAEDAATTEETSPDCRELASIAVEECDSLLSIMNSMLEISQMQTGLSPAVFQDIDCSKIAAETCEMFQTVAEDKKIDLRTGLLEPISVKGDAIRLQHAVSNLVDNALKFTEAGGTITVSVGSENGQATITVRDTGLGIDECDLPHVFERFYRGDRTRAMKGNGLGLGLVQAVVSMHEGTVTVESKPGAGSTFTVRLPAAKPAS